MKWIIVSLGHFYVEKEMNVPMFMPIIHHTFESPFFAWDLLLLVKRSTTLRSTLRIQNMKYARIIIILRTQKDRIMVGKFYHLTAKTTTISRTKDGENQTFPIQTWNLCKIPTSPQMNMVFFSLLRIDDNSCVLSEAINENYEMEINWQGMLNVKNSQTSMIRKLLPNSQINELSTWFFVGEISKSA